MLSVNRPGGCLHLFGNAPACLLYARGSVTLAKSMSVPSRDGNGAVAFAGVRRTCTRPLPVPLRGLAGCDRVGSRLTASLITLSLGAATLRRVLPLPSSTASRKLGPQFHVVRSE